MGVGGRWTRLLTAGGGNRRVIESLERRTLLSLGLGQLDPFFADGQIISVGGSNSDTTIAGAIVSLPDGSAYVAGNQHNKAIVTRITFDGAVDTTFGAAGFSYEPINGANVVGAALEPDGSLAVASTTNTAGAWDYAIFRVNQTGAIDTAFGLRTIDFSNNKDIISGLLAQPDGKLIGFGHLENGNKSIATMARLNEDGSLDTTFGTGGLVTFDITPGGGKSSEFSGGVLLSDGKIMLVGFANDGTNKLMLARFLDNGQPDTTFSPGGAELIAMTRPFGSTIVAAPGGGFYVAVGDVFVNLQRYDASGTLDTTFGSGGTVSVFSSARGDTESGLLVQADGSILVSNNYGNGWELARVISSGQLDTTFGTGGSGIVKQYLGTNGEVAVPLAAEPDGRALIAGGWVDFLSGLQDGLVVARYQTEPLSNEAYFNASTGIVNVFGTEQADTVQIDTVDPEHTNVVLNEVSSALDVEALRRIDIRLFGADDVITLAEGNGTAVQVDGGDGSDEISVVGGSGDDHLSLLSGSMAILGFTLLPTNLESLVVDMGAGNDVITTDASFPFSTTIACGAGDDEIDLVSPSGFAGLTFDGGDGSDQLNVLGSASADSLAINGSTVSFGALSAGIDQIENVLLDGSGGDDSFSLAGTVSAAVSIDGGQGNDQVTVTGTAADDAFELLDDEIDAPNVQASYSGLEGIILAGGSGNDNFTLSGFAPGCAVTVMGQAGNDSLTIAAAPIASIVFQGGTDAGSTHQLNVLAGTFTLTSDAALSTSGLSISVATGASVVFQASQHLSSLSLDGGTALLEGPANSVIRTSQLSVQSGGTLDLQSHALIYDYSGPTSPLSSVLPLLNAGRNGGLWNGMGITSSVAASKPGTAVGVAESAMLFSKFPASYLGGPIDSTALVLRYTYGGDANLDQYVDVRDLSLVAANWQASGKIFAQGDFNYDGKVDVTDLQILANNWGKTSSGVSLAPPLSAMQLMLAMPTTTTPTVPPSPPPAPPLPTVSIATDPVVLQTSVTTPSTSAQQTVTPPKKPAVSPTSSISGSVFNDRNRDGKRKGSDAGLAGWRVFIDSNGDGILDDGETSVLTDAKGNWTISNLDAGTYKVRIVTKRHWAVTTSKTGSVNVVLPKSTKSVRNLFGVVHLT